MGCPRCAGTGRGEAGQECASCWGTGAVYQDTGEPATKEDAGTGTFPDRIVLPVGMALGFGTLFGGVWLIDWIRSVLGH
ncbi:hypothetical protein [Streptacidiphilus cavernicola]|uniref:Uncharacterized protein n=1 Tax=Streptacidiphilus cavernicola TaxID=3342716 RepID=A0ABV6VXV6_9ACTN